jgi:hypothetical protein
MTGPPTPASPSWRAADPPPMQVPVITEAERRLAQGDYPRAVSDAYHRVVLDLQKAYGLTLPAQWTHREFLSDFLRDDMGILTSRVARLYRMYEPIRYGGTADSTAGDLVDLLRQIYAEPPMRDLYVPSNGSSGRRGSAAGTPPPRPSTRTDSFPRPE